jgi:hypothetical protein
MIKPVTYYQAVCDGCGYIDEDGDYAAWGDAVTAEQVALDSDWTKDENDRLLCAACTEKRANDDAEADQENQS